MTDAIWRGGAFPPLPTSPPPGRAPESTERAQLLEARRRRDDDPHLALRLLEELNSPGLRHADPATSGRASLLRAEILRDKGEHDRAGGAIQAARHDLLAAGLTLEAYGTDIVRGSMIRALGDPERSVDILQSILGDLPDATVSWADRDALSRVRAHVHRQLGLSRRAAADPTAAVHDFDVAWNRFHALGDGAFAARTSAERAGAYLQLDLTHRALDDLERARDDLGALGEVTAAARCGVLLSKALVRLDRIPEAVRVLEDVRPVFEHRGYLPETAELDLALSEALLHAGLTHDARLEAQAAAEIFASLDHIEGTAQARFVTGLASLGSGDVTGAAADLDLAERLTRSSRHRQELALVRLGGMLTAPERDVPDHARHLAALTHGASATDPVMRALSDLTDAFLHPEGRPAERLLDDVRRAVDQHDLQGLDVARAVVAAHVLRHRGDPAGAVAELVTALTRASSARAFALGAYRPLSHLLLVGLADRVLLDTLLAIDTPDSITEAWRWAAVTRARSLTDLASTAAQQRRPPVLHPPLPVHHEGELRTLSRVLDQLIDPEGDVDLEAIRRTHVAVRRDIRQQIPHARLPLTLDGDVDLPPVPEGPVLQYHVLDDHIVAFVVREGQVYSRRLVGAAPEVDTFVAEWHAECSRVQIEDGRGTGLPTHHSLLALSTLLLAPLTDLLLDLEDLPLVLTAPARLQAVPFEALPVVTASAEPRPLSAAFSVRFASGLHDLGAVADAELPEIGSSLLALMVPDETAPRIADETSVLAGLHPDATILSGAAATVDALAHLGGKHDIVHIACHGLYWPEHPSSSGLRLGDRWVTAGEILRMDLRDTLVILNACATGRAHDTTSESVGLTWALLAAGARGVVATTWPVDDGVALAFATSFHRHLQEGLAPACAVRRASIDVSEEFSDHPWAWAAHRYVTAGSTVLGEL